MDVGSGTLATSSRWHLKVRRTSCSALWEGAQNSKDVEVWLKGKRGGVDSWSYWYGTAGVQQLPYGLIILDYVTGPKDSACFPHHARPTQ